MNSTPPSAPAADPYTTDAYAAYWSTVEGHQPAPAAAGPSAVRDAYAEFCDHADL